MCQDIADSFKGHHEELQKQLFPARVLGPGNRTLSSGQATLEAEAPLGAFYPDVPIGQGIDPASAETLQSSSKGDFAIRSFRLCECRTHYRFEVVRALKSH